MTCPMNKNSLVVCRILSKQKTLVGQGFEVLLILKRVMGIEPTLLAWKAKVLPLNYTRMIEDLLLSSLGI